MFTLEELDTRAKERRRAHNKRRREEAKAHKAWMELHTKVHDPALIHEWVRGYTHTSVSAGRLVYGERMLPAEFAEGEYQETTVFHDAKFVDDSVAFDVTVTIKQGEKEVETRMTLWRPIHENYPAPKTLMEIHQWLLVAD
jgi:hypothetical protein